MGVGYRLVQKFESVGISHKKGGCECKDTAARMDKEGPQWCRDNMAWILEQIASNAKRRGSLYSEAVARSFVLSSISDEEEHLKLLADTSEVAKEARIADIIADVNAGHRQREPGWQNRPDVIEAVKRIINERIAAIKKPPDSFFWEGRGIVTLAGTVTYFPCAYVLCRMLRKLGCKLPIEVWYLDDTEMDDRMIAIMEELGDVLCVNFQKRVPTVPRVVGGWEAKAWAIQHSRFEEVLFLDADVVPTRNVDGMFNQFIGGVVWWSNYLHSVSFGLSKSAFEMFGFTAPKCNGNFPHHAKPDDYTPWETGQIFFRKKASWESLEVAKILSDYSDFFYPANDHNIENWHSYGDTGTFPLAVAISGQLLLSEVLSYCQTGQPDKFGGPRGGGLNQFSPHTSEVWFQHRCLPRYKIRVSGENPTDGIFEAELFTESINELKSKWTPYVWNWKHQSPSELAIAGEAVGPKHATGLPLKDNRIVLLPDGKVDGGVNLRWRIATIDGNTRLIVADAKHGLAVCEQYPNGWIDHVRGVNIQHMAPQWWDGMEESLSASVWCEVFLHNTYRLPDSLAGQVIIDVGAHEGVFSHLAFERGASHVVSIEPVRENYSKLVKNLSGRPGSLCVNAACWRSDDNRRFIRMVTPVGQDFHSSGMMARGASEVDGHAISTISLDHAIESALELSGKGRVSLIKIDAECSEFPILLHASSGMYDVDALCVELHMGHLWQAPDWWGVPRTGDEALAALEGRMTALGFSHRIGQRSPCGKFAYLWAWRGECPFAF